MATINRPNLVRRNFAALHLLPKFRLIDIANGGGIRLGELQVNIAARMALGGHGLGTRPALEGENHLLHGNTLANHRPQEVLIAARRRECRVFSSIIAREVEEYEVRLISEDIALKAEHPEIRPCAANGSVHEGKVRFRIFRREIIAHQPTESCAVGLGRIGAPSQRPTEVDHRQFFARARLRIKVGETRLFCRVSRVRLCPAERGNHHSTSN